MFAGNRAIRRNPPSSGFIGKSQPIAGINGVIYFFCCPGLALLLPHCPQVNIVEYVPSTRLNGRCHYYSKEVRRGRSLPLTHT